jgi:hypothetical protein
MNRIAIGLTTLFLLALHLNAADAPAKRSPKEALQAFNSLIGSWKATGTPEGTREEKQRGFWIETVRWEWQFKGGDAWLTVAFDKGKHFRKGELRYLPEKDLFQLRLETAAQETLRFEGPFKDGRLTLDRRDEDKKQDQRLTVSLLHANRFLYHYQVKPLQSGLYTKLYQVGATKEGVPFAAGDGKPECIVSGGLGTMAVTYKGQTYYVCCSGCRSAFNEEPERYIKEYEESKAKKRDEKKPQPE